MNATIELFGGFLLIYAIALTIYFAIAAIIVLVIAGIVCYITGVFKKESVERMKILGNEEIIALLEGDAQEAAEYILHGTIRDSMDNNKVYLGAQPLDVVIKLGRAIGQIVSDYNDPDIFVSADFHHDGKNNALYICDRSSSTFNSGERLLFTWDNK